MIMSENVAGVEPAILETLCGEDGVTEVAPGYGRALEPEDSLASRGQDVSFIIADLYGVSRHCPADGAGLPERVAGVTRHHGRALGEAVPLERDNTEVVSETLLEAGIKLAASREDVAEPSGKDLAPGCRSKDKGKHGGHGDENLRPGIPEPGKEVLQWQETGEQCLGKAPEKGQQAADGIAEGMEVGEDVHEDPALLEPLNSDMDRPCVVVQVPVGYGDRLGGACCAGGGEDHGHIGILVGPVTPAAERRQGAAGQCGDRGDARCTNGIAELFHSLTYHHGVGIHMIQDAQDPFRPAPWI